MFSKCYENPGRFSQKSIKLIMKRKPDQIGVFVEPLVKYNAI